MGMAVRMWAGALLLENAVTPTKASASAFASLGSIQFSGYLRIPPFPPFFHPDTWIRGFVFTALWGSRLPLGKMGEMGPARVPFFHPFAPHFYTISLHFSFLLEHFHTFSMMYLQQLPIFPHFSPFSPIFPHFSSFFLIFPIFPIFPVACWILGYSGYGYFRGLPLTRTATCPAPGALSSLALSQLSWGWSCFGRIEGCVRTLCGVCPAACPHAHATVFRSFSGCAHPRPGETGPSRCGRAVPALRALPLPNQITRDLVTLRTRAFFHLPASTSTAAQWPTGNTTGRQPPFCHGIWCSPLCHPAPDLWL